MSARILAGSALVELGLQFRDDLGEGALAVAALEHLPAGALQFDCAFGEQDHLRIFCASLIFGAPSATGRQAWLAGVFGRGHASVPAPGNARIIDERKPRVSPASEAASSTSLRSGRNDKALDWRQTSFPRSETPRAAAILAEHMRSRGASSCAHRMSHLSRSAWSANSCSARVFAFSYTRVHREPRIFRRQRNWLRNSLDLPPARDSARAIFLRAG